MKATFTPEQRDIQQSVRSIAKEEKVTARDALAGQWREPACDAVLLGDFGLLGVPESAGGMGSSLVDLLVAVEALGEHLVPSRFPAHAAAVQLALGLGALPDDVLAGRTVLTPAVDLPGDPGWPGREAADPLVRTLVPYAVQADKVVALAADGVWIAEPERITVRESLDPSVPLSDVTLAAPAQTAPVGLGAGRAALVAAAQLCGVAAGAIELAAGHARTRTQFGRVIGSFQGVAFQLADAVTRRKAAWDLTLYAAWAVDKGRPEAESLVHAAKAAAGSAAVFAAERCIQVHGGMGITMEADPHLFLRRAHVLDAWLGRGRWHRRRVGRLQVQRRRKAQAGTS
ncbi:acyl-CoA dehydrogenase [Thermomonospora curvata]|uniref:Acyl-CoA dehydrogenase domain protein n=1 Tax=Thermomonospora curvata (strain ATCC 19995 / DSM 43183 / JCM 3096 / KCTC 9072 / NBRC 15933 / NCIMB 10081 / Henssen B9) TaxID=471852 RepID=D1A5W1_THECD|nr:acyl-CoA dehydrogenase [Thermomonospora curvata]ACY98256.1 acyl-CoA dehydrogenase domain protein [Thermomonospora curvata DSM 43183]